MGENVTALIELAKAFGPAFALVVYFIIANRAREETVRVDNASRELRMVTAITDKDKALEAKDVIIAGMNAEFNKCRRETIDKNTEAIFAANASRSENTAMMKTLCEKIETTISKRRTDQ